MAIVIVLAQYNAQHHHKQFFILAIKLVNQGITNLTFCASLVQKLEQKIRRAVIN